MSISKESVTIKIPWSKSLFLEGAKVIYDYDMRHSWRRYFGWFLIALSQFGVVMAMKGGAIGLLLLSTILIIYWYSLRWSFRKRLLERFFDKEEREAKLNISLSKEGVAIDKKILPWESFKRAIITDNSYLLEINSNRFLYLPYRFFSDKDRALASKIIFKNIKQLKEAK